MSAVRTVLFDLDDTLFDHRGCARAALSRVHAGHECFAGRPFEAFERAHGAFLETMHRRVLAGEIGLDEAREERFRLLFEWVGVRATGETLQTVAATYRDAYVASRRAVAGATELLAALKPIVRIGVVSNNLLDEQREKLRECGLERYVDALVVSEEVGVSKPDPAIFLFALERLDARADETVMIGDSWAADVAGALASGIRPIWLNLSRAPAPDPGVRQLAALLPIEEALAAVFGAPTPSSSGMLADVQP
jgi:putative hydrolase of the HAD superfamily